MDKLSVSKLESLLKFKGSYGPNVIISDASILTCGCLVSESYFVSRLKSDSKISGSDCPNCHAKNVSILAEVTPLRELFSIIQELNIHLSKSKRKSSSKKSIRSSAIDRNETHKTAESMDLISLFYKFAKEENSKSDESRHNSTEDVVSSVAKQEASNESLSAQAYTTFPETNTSMTHNMPSVPIVKTMKEPFSDEHKLLANFSEEKEYNFSKCFPFHRKLSSFPTQQSKFNISSLTRGSIMKKSATFICSDIHTFIDMETNCEVTRFVLITNKKWELYEYKVNVHASDGQSHKVLLLCCGKLSGEYGKDFNNLQEGLNDTEIIVKNDFSSSHNNPGGNSSSVVDKEKKLRIWDQLFCKLSKNYLLIGGTKGVMRILNISPSSLSTELGKPLYMYVTNFPIRCIAISPNESLVACGITAKERLSSKEQPFIILHKLNKSTIQEARFESVEPITITIPYRDPIKIINFNPASTHILCCTVWESRYLIIKLRSKYSDDYRKPRLVWADFTYSSYRKNRNKDSDSGSEEDTDDFHLMDDEGITDLQFGTLSSNAIFLTSCSLKNKPSYVIRLDGEVNSKRRSSTGHGLSDNCSQAISFLSNQSKNEENESEAYISGSEIIMKIPEIGSSIHRLALLPRGDGMVFLDKAGHIFLVSTPNFQLHPTSSLKSVVVQLGEVANAARYYEAASLKFSADGGKLYSVDRKGVFQVYDFTKGIPGQDSDVVKCKIIKV